MMKVACTVMLKDESTLIYPFLAYHSHLFGAENLFVFDNGSTDPHVLKTLEYFSQLGAHIDYKHNTNEDYQRKGQIIGELVKKLDLEENYDLYILLDCDEFVVLKEGESFSSERRKILNHLQEFVGEKRIVTVDKNLSNVPGRAGLFQLAPYNKTIFPHDVLISTDHGHHIGTGKHSSERVSSDIVYVHYHYRTYEEVVRFARQKLQLRISEDDLNDREFLRTYRGRGWHLVGHLLSDKAAYYKQFENERRFIEFNDLIVTFLQLGIKPPFSADDWSASQFQYEVTVDEVNGSRVRGWAMNRADPNDPAHLSFLIDGRTVWEGLCILQRKDVGKSGRPTDMVGFDIPLTSINRSERRVTLTIQNSKREDIGFRFGRGLVSFLEFDI